MSFVRLVLTTATVVSAGYKILVVSVMGYYLIKETLAGEYGRKRFRNRHPDDRKGNRSRDPFHP